jgi:alpha-ribazole phosphatase
MKITFIRHSTLNIAQGICYGQSDVDVSANFDNEAQALRQTLLNKTFDAVFTSPLQRCSKLAKACGYAHAVPDSRLKELNFGAWEMKAWDEIVDPQIELWYSNWLDERPTDGESFYDMI